MEFASWAKSAAEKRELETIHQELAQLRADLDELREEQRRQAWASRMGALTRKNERRTVGYESEPSPATIALVSLGAMALIVHAARDGNDPAATVRGAGDASHTKSEALDTTGESVDTAVLAAPLELVYGHTATAATGRVS